jgi:hypothetical protein
MSDEEQEEGAPRRPRVIDKRISARTAPTPAPVEAPPARESPSAGESPASGSGPTAGEATASPSTPAPQASPPPPPGAGFQIPPASPRSEAPGPGDEPGAGALGGGAGEGVWTPEQEADAQRMAREIADTPSFEWVVNAAVTLANVAATKLELGAGADAQLAIDALAGLVNSVGPRMQQAESPLRQTLAQLQLAYAQRLSAPPAP